MTAERERLEEERDQALRDLVDLDRQVAEGELPAGVADRLRADYERAAATAMTLLAQHRDPPPAAREQRDPAADLPAEPEDAAGDGETRPSRTGGVSRARWVAYGLAAAAAVFAAAVLLPGSLVERIAGGAVTGNEVFGTSAAASPTTRDLSTVSNAEMEQVVAQNPDVVGMRLALAHRYLNDGDYLAATRHYLVVLRQEPRNVEALSHYGWVLLQLDDPQRAMDYVDRALTQDPQQVEALWFKANIALYGLDDPATAIAVLQQLQQRPDLSADVRDQVDQLLQQARAGDGAG